MKYIVATLIASSLCVVSWGSPARDAQKEMGMSDTAWKVVKEEEQTISWLAEPGTVVSLMIHPGFDKNLPPQDSKPELYAYYRSEALGCKGGLVEVDTRQKSGVGFNLITMKFPLREMSPEMKNSLGWGYQVNAVFPTRDRTYVVQVAAIESGTTGVRESTVMIIYMQQSGIKDLAEAAKKFRHDPYEKKYDDGALFTASDERRWDSGFPTHPLTRSRAYMEKVLGGLSLSSKITGSALYKKEVSNQAPEPTPTAVTPPAGQEARQP